jgi:NAD(P)-dependent dehydrogenase (short-subunit alcohol dehydrogenase family)
MDDDALIAGVKPGLRVLVTAGAAGIGRVIADSFVRHEARVMVCDIEEAALADWRSAHPDHPAARADVGVQSEVDALFDELERTLGGLDVLVNNAGIAGPTAAVEAIDPADWQRAIDVNLSGQFYCLRRAVPMLKEVDDGAIINIASVAGRLGYAYRLPYAATKWAIVGMTQSLSIELGKWGIRVNAILPGIVEGPRIRCATAIWRRPRSVGWSRRRTWPTWHCSSARRSGATSPASRSACAAT